MSKTYAFAVGAVIGVALALSPGCGTATNCTAANCQGCCTMNGLCANGQTAAECGQNGATCQQCTGDQGCTPDGICAVIGNQGGGSSSNGGGSASNGGGSTSNGGGGGGSSSNGGGVHAHRRRRRHDSQRRRSRQHGRRLRRWLRRDRRRHVWRRRRHARHLRSLELRQRVLPGRDVHQRRTAERQPVRPGRLRLPGCAPPATRAPRGHVWEPSRAGRRTARPAAAAAATPACPSRKENDLDRAA